MKKLLLLVLLFPLLAAGQVQKVTTKDGKDIVFNPDGTWQYEMKSTKADSISTTEMALVKKINTQIGRMQAGFILGGITMTMGAAINLVTLGKNPPDAASYTDVVEFNKELDAYESSQKGLKKGSAYCYVVGGVFMIITGIKISTITLKQKDNKSLSLISKPNGASLSFNF